MSYLHVKLTGMIESTGALPSEPLIRPTAVIVFDRKDRKKEIHIEVHSTDSPLTSPSEFQPQFIYTYNRDPLALYNQPGVVVLSVKEDPDCSSYELLLTKNVNKVYPSYQKALEEGVIARIELILIKETEV